jgi:hypothetical protein
MTFMICSIDGRNEGRSPMAGLVNKECYISAAYLCNPRAFLSRVRASREIGFILLTLALQRNIDIRKRVSIRPITTTASLEELAIMLVLIITWELVCVALFITDERLSIIQSGLATMILDHLGIA